LEQHHSPTTAPPQPHPREAVEWEHETYETQFAGQKITIYRYDKSRLWRLNSRLGNGWVLPLASTAEEAIAEAVRALTQHLDWLSTELAAISSTIHVP